MKNRSQTRGQRVKRERTAVRQRAAGSDATQSGHLHAERSLQKERDRFQRYLDVAGIMIVAIDADERVVLINKKGCEVLGYTQDEILGRDWFQTCIPERMRDQVREVFAQSMAGGIEPGTYHENPVVTRAGEERLIAWHNTILQDEGGRIVATLSSGEDITDRRRAEDALRKSETTARALLESAADGIVIADRDGRIVLANAKTEKMFGYPREDLLGQPLEVLLPERFRTAHVRHRAAYFDEPRVRPMGMGFDLAGLRKDGTEFPVEISLSYIETEDGLRAMASVTDITERKRAETRQKTQFAVTQVLAESRSLRGATSPLLQAICEGIGWELGELWRVDPARNVLRWDGIWYAPALGAGEFEALSRDTTFSMGSGLPGRVWASGEPACICDVRTDVHFERMAGVDKIGLRGAMAFPIRSERKVTGVMVFYCRRVSPPDHDLLNIMADIGSRIGQFTERKRAEEGLARQAQELARLGREAQVREAFIRNVVESIGDGIVVLDKEGRITGWNRAMEERYGIAASEVQGLPIVVMFPALKPEGFEEVLARVLGGSEDVALEGFQHSTRDRRQVTVNIKGNPLRTPTGEVIGAVLTVEDVTEHIELERIARQAEKMAAVGTLAAGIAHEINNPIGIISSRVELMLMEAGEKGMRLEMIKDLQVLEKHAGRVAKITQGLLSFSRQAPWRLDAVDVNHVVEAALLLVEKQLAKEGIVLKKDLVPGLPKIQGSQNHLEQVVLNLVTNAREAMSAGGTLRISTAATRIPLIADPPGRGQVGDRSAVVEQPGVEVQVSDTGPGIPSEILPRIFDPFFTTKEQGTGLGLSISYGIVREHGGTITVESKPEEGSVFIVRLPVAQWLRTQSERRGHQG